MSDFDDDPSRHSAPTDPTAHPRRAWTLRGLTVLIVITAAGVLAAAGWRDSADLPGDLVASLGEAKKANASHDIEGERRILEHAEGLSGSAEDAAEVQRRLAVLDWKNNARFDVARERLLAATKGARPAEAWLALARLEQARKDFAAAHEAAKKAGESAETALERWNARLAVARAAVAEAVALRRAGELADTAALRDAFADLHDLVRRESGVLEPSRLLLQAALILDRRNGALMAWRSYFHVASGPLGGERGGQHRQDAPNAVAGAGAELERLLSAWDGPETPPAARIDLVQALADSRFFTEAALVAADPRGAQAVRVDADVRDTIAYADLIDRLREITEEYYRRLALGEGSRSKFDTEVHSQLRGLVQELTDAAAGNARSDEAVKSYLARRFGAYVSLHRTAGYYDLHMGHRVVDERRTVEQYGRRAELRFVALDNMVSNGFQSWAWDDGQHGGWASTETIYQVRPAYAGAALEVWRNFQSEDELRKWKDDMDRESARDDERARQDPYAYLPGLGMRLKLQGVERLIDKLRAEGLAGEDLRLRFVADLERAGQESSIFAHEGRHAIDKRAGQSSSRSLEYTAKLSEVAFAPQPRLALGAIVSANIGDDTPHGRANLKVMKGLVAWMDQHRTTIAGLDQERPLLPQFDLLTDEQIRQAFRSMDPLAGKG